MILGLSRTPISPPRWRREQGETFALPVVLSTDSSHQSLPLALRDDEQKWRAYLSRLGFNEVSAPPPLIGNYLVHQEFWQLSKSHSPGTCLVCNLEFFLRVELKIASHIFIKSTVWQENKRRWLDSSMKNCVGAYGNDLKLWLLTPRCLATNGALCFFLIWVQGI